jgi:hypothetical protein
MKGAQQVPATDQQINVRETFDTSLPSSSIPAAGSPFRYGHAQRDPVKCFVVSGQSFFAR